MVNAIKLNAQPIRELKHNRNLSFGAENPKQPKEKVSSETGDIKPKRKFSIVNAGKNYVKGIFAPVRKMIDGGIKGVLVTIGTGAIIGTVLNKIAEKGVKIKPVLTTLFAGVGAIEIGKGIYEFITNKGNPGKQEESFKDMGEGTTVAGISVLFAKPALKGISSDAEIVKMGYKDSFIKCVKTTISTIKGNWKTIGNTVLESIRKIKSGETLAYTAGITDVFDPSSIHTAVQAGMLDEANKVTTILSKTKDEK